MEQEIISVKLTSPMIAEISDDFPAPMWPATPKNCPGWTFCKNNKNDWIAEELDQSRIKIRLSPHDLQNLLNN